MEKSWLSKFSGWWSGEPGISLNGSESDLYELLSGFESSSGVRVSPKTILQNPAVWRGVNLLSGRMAIIPFTVYERINDNREKARYHPAYKLLSIRPKLNLPPSVWRQSIAHDALIYGNSYSYIMRNGSEPDELLWLDPAMTTINKDGDYETVMEDKKYVLPPSDVIHLRGLSNDGGKTGIPLWAALREALGLGLSLQSFSNYYFSNNANPSMVIYIPVSYLADKKKEALKEFKADWVKNYSGLKNSNSPSFLPNDFKAEPFTNTNRDSQWIEAREHDLIMVANCLGCPPSKLGSRNQISFASLESDEKNFLSEMNNWIVKLEEELSLKLLTEQELLTESHYIEANRKVLVQIDAETEQSLLDKALESGRYSFQEVRKMENKTIDESELEKMLFFFPNRKPSWGLPKEEEPQEQAPQPQQEQVEEQEDIQASKLKNLTENVCNRLFKRVKKAILHQSKNDDWQDYLKIHLLEEHKDVFLKELHVYENADEVIDEFLTDLVEELDCVSREDINTVLERQNITAIAKKLGDK